MKILSNPKRTRQAKVGDVVTSPFFLDGIRSEGVIRIYPKGFVSLRDNPSLEHLVSHDLTRKYAWHVVEKTERTTRWQDMPNGWYCTARRLSKNHKYDPNGELIEFVQMESSDPNFIEWVTRVASMEHVFE